MRQVYGLLFIISCLGSFLHAQESSDDWVGYWINGVEFTKDQNSYPKAIETYNTAIRTLTPHQISVQLNLINERGDLYFHMLDYKSAIQDYSFILNHPQANQEQKMQALWGRSKAYLATGKIQEFEKDSQQLEQLESFITPIAETKEYTIVKMNPYVLRDEQSHKRFIKLLMMRKEIKSEKDVTFTPSGFIIIKNNQTN